MTANCTYCTSFDTNTRSCSPLHFIKAIFNSNGFTAICWALAAFQFLNPIDSRQIPWTGDQPDARPLPTRGTIQAQN
jgi:hypothetical protein